MRHPPADDRNLQGWLYRVALRKTRRGVFRGGREVELADLSSALCIPPTVGTTGPPYGGRRSLERSGVIK